MDENDRLRNGNLHPNAFKGARPVNDKARADDSQRVTVATVREIVTAAAQDARAKKSNRSLTTGHYRLDAATCGFEPGFVWVMGASTSWGKSTWLVSIADENIQRKKRVLIVSAEDPESLYGRRLLLRRARVSAHRLRHKRLTQEELERIAVVEREAEDMPVFLSAYGKPFEKLAPRIEGIVRSEGIDMVAFDYLQALTTEKRSKDRRQEVNHLTRLCTDLVKNQGKAGLILSQLTTDKQTKGPPSEYSIRESQDVSNGAEVIVLGYTPDRDVLSNDRPGRDAQGRELEPEVIFKAGQRYLLLVKNKAGERKLSLQMDWNEHSACFNRVADPERELHDRLHDELGSSDWDTVPE